jgi:hypothetical protein
MKFGSDIKIPKYYGFEFGREVAIFNWTRREPTLNLGKKKAREGWEAMKLVKALKKGI